MNTIELYKVRGSNPPRFDWRLKAPNGGILASSHGQGYNRLEYCKLKVEQVFPDYILDWPMESGYLLSRDHQRLRLLDLTRRRSRR